MRLCSCWKDSWARDGEPMSKGEILRSSTRTWLRTKWSATPTQTRNWLDSSEDGPSQTRLANWSIEFDTRGAKARPVLWQAESYLDSLSCSMFVMLHVESMRRGVGKPWLGILAWQAECRSRGWATNSDELALHGRSWDLRADYASQQTARARWIILLLFFFWSVFLTSKLSFRIFGKFMAFVT